MNDCDECKQLPLIDGRWGDVKPTEPLSTQRTKADREAWRRARGFQRRVELSLRGLKVPFAAWLVLVTLHELEVEIGEELNQNSVANRAALSRMVVSYWIAIFERDGWVYRDEHFKPQAFGVGLTERGLGALRQCHERLEGFRGNE